MKRINLALAITAIFLFGTAFYSCKNPTEGVTININTHVLKSPTAVKFVNAKKNAPNQPTDFPVTVGGKDAASVVTITNKTTFVATEGRIFLALKKGIVPSESDPIIFTIAAEVPGFAPATHTFRITKDVPLSVVVPMVEYANPVVGTAAKIQDHLLVAGTTADAITIQTPSIAGMDEQATITIAPGTQFKDIAGNAINAVKLESRVVNYGTSSNESLATFPGGFNAASVVGENGQLVTAGVAFTTAGFIAIDMYAGATEVKSFSKPLNVNMEINKNVMNPVTGQKVKAGDVLPVWSLDDKAGQWAFESNATIIADAAGDLNASFSASHLSYWNFDWASAFCTNELTLVFNAEDYLNDSYSVAIINDKGYSSASTLSIADKLTTSFRVPTGNIKVIVRDINGNVVTETPYFDACAAGTVTLNMPKAADLDIVNVDLVLKGSCPNKPVNANLSTWVRLYEQIKGVQNSYVVYMVNGKINLKVKNNAKYVVEAYYGDQWKTTEILFTKANFSFPGFITGTAVFVESTKTLSVDAQFPLPDCN
jgi:hypothetical protein